MLEFTVPDLELKTCTFEHLESVMTSNSKYLRRAPLSVRSFAVLHWSAAGCRRGQQSRFTGLGVRPRSRA